MFIPSDDVSALTSWHCFSVNEKAQDILLPRVEPLLKEQLDNAFESIEAAFENDPMVMYIKEGQEESASFRAMRKRFWKWQVNRRLKQKVSYTINDGDSLVITTPPEGDTSKPSPIDRTINFLLGSFKQFLLWTSQNSESVKRLNELDRKMKKLYETELGDKTKSMYYVDLLATKSEAQGHGFATALLDTILFSADIRGRSVYLSSSNIDNVPFYESFGFVRSAHILLGDDNPKWTKPPVVIPLMIRSAKRNVRVSTNTSCWSVSQ